MHHYKLLKSHIQLASNFCIEILHLWPFLHQVRDLVPESQAYMDLLAFERKLDLTIMRKRLDIQEALKRPMKQKKKLRIFISNTYFPAKHEEGAGDGGEETVVASWELRVEGRLLDEVGLALIRIFSWRISDIQLQNEYGHE